MDSFQYSFKLKSETDKGSKVYSFETADGVASKEGFREAELLLADTVETGEDEDILVLYPGYGFLGVIFADYTPEATTVLAESSDRSHQIAKHNLEENGIENAESRKISSPNDIDQSFDKVLYAPKPYANTDIVKNNLTEAIQLLTEDGELYLASSKKEGLNRYKDWLKQFNGELEKVNSRNGYHVYTYRKKGEIEDRKVDVERSFEAEVNGVKASFETVEGLFSPNSLDEGSRLLIENIETEELKDAIVNNPTKFPEAMDSLVDESAIIMIEYMGMEVDEEEEYVKNISDEERETFISVFLNLVNWGTIFAFMKGDSENEEVNEVIGKIFTQAENQNPDSLKQVMSGPIDIENEAMAMYNGLKRAFPRLARENPDRQMRIADSISAHKSIFEGLYIPFLNLLIDITEVKTGDEFGGGPPGNKIEWLEARYDFNLAPVVDDRYRKLKNAESHESHDSSSFTGSREGIEIKGLDGDIEMILSEDEFMEVVDLQAKSILQSLKHLNSLYTKKFIE